MRRKWCFVVAIVTLCYCNTLFIGLNLLDAEQTDAESSRLTRATTPAAAHRSPLAHSLCTRPGHTSIPANCSTGGYYSGRGVLLIGVGFLGSRLAAKLVASGEEVQIVSHNHDIGADELLWYRKEQLQDLGMEVRFMNLSDHRTVQRLVNTSRPKTLVYIPPGMDGDEDIKPDNIVWSKYLEEFVLLLETLRTFSPCTRVLLASTSQPAHMTSHDLPNLTVLKAWMMAFELTLATYHNIYSVQITVFRASGVYGPWSKSVLQHFTTWQRDKVPHSKWCWYVSDVTNALFKALQLNSDCDVLDLSECHTVDKHSNGNTDEIASQTVDGSYRYTTDMLNITSDPVSLEKGSQLAMSWAASYSKHKSQALSQDRVFTSYFTSVADSQRKRHKAPNTFQYIQDWFQSIKKLGLKAVIFHDGLDAQFQHRLIQHYGGVEFQRVDSLRNRSTNDARFYSYLSYLSTHTTINRVLLTDVSDVRFQMNPFELFNLLGQNMLYIGTDIDIFPSMATMPWISTRLETCFGNYSVKQGDLHALMHLDTVYNAGTIGGSRDTVLEVLHRIVELLESTPSGHNCNMPAVNYAVHKHFYDRVFTGFPLNSRFLRRQATPKGVYIVHK